MNKYFLQRDGRTFGPYSLDDLKRYLGEGRIGPTDMIREGDDGQFMPQTDFFGRFAPDAPVAMTLPSFKAPKPMNPAPAQTPATPQAPFTPAAPQTPQVPFTPTPAPQATPPAPQQSPFAASTPSSPFGGNDSPFSAPAPKPAEQMFPPIGSTPDAGSPFGGGQTSSPFGAPQAPQQQFGGFPPMGVPQAPMGGPQGMQSGFGQQPGGPAPAGGGVLPPPMQWWLVWIISIVTCNLFYIYWMFQVAGFVGKIDPNSKAKKNILMGLAAVIGGYILLFVMTFIGSMAESATISLLGSSVGSLFALGGFVLIIVAAFDIRKSLLQYYNSVENIGLKLSPIMTFFFSFIYFTFHFNRITEWKTTGVLK